MSEDHQARGRCLCGAVQFNVSKLGKEAGACHCSMCRTWGGGPLLAVDCGTEVACEAGQEHISVFDSSAWAERGFCGKCGTHLLYRLKDSRQYIMPVGLFQDEQAFVFDHQIFIDEKPAYYSFANETENMTGAEVFAKYAPPQD